MGYGQILALALIAALAGGCQTAQTQGPASQISSEDPLAPPSASGGVARAMNDPFAFGAGVSNPGPFGPSL